MMAVIVILLILVLVAFLTALIPIRIDIDTREEEFFLIAIGRLVQCKGEASEKGLFLSLQLPAYRKKINLLEPGKPSTKKKPEKKGKSRSIKLSSPLRLLKAFRLQTMVWELDTGDFLQNAKLYPLFRILSHGTITLSVNFSGHNRLKVKAYTRFFYLAVALLKS